MIQLLDEQPDAGLQALREVGVNLHDHLAVHTVRSAERADQ